MSVAIYLRVSTEEQRERQSIETQRVYAEQFCALNTIEIGHWFADDGVTGTVPLSERPGGAALMAAVAAGDVGTVLVYKLDRIGRHPRVILNAIGDLEAGGVEVRSMTEPFDTSTGAGRFMLGILSAVAGLERDTIIERSWAGMERLAHAGTWLGGIVPYGYRTAGTGQDRKLVISEELLPGHDTSEADVVRMIFRMCAEEGRSCKAIADSLNALGIPPSYAIDDRRPARGKRKRATAGIWRHSRVRNMIVSCTYKGTHLYGKRSKDGRRGVIRRDCPAIITPEQWERAQGVLIRNRLYSARNSRRQYLLRGLVKCQLCGLTYIGHSARDYTDGSPRHYYTCNGRYGHRGIYGALGQKCPAKPVEGGALEDVVMADILEFLQRPETALTHLAAEVEEEALSREKLIQRRMKWERALARSHGERERLLGLFRKGLVVESELDTQFAEIRAEQEQILRELERLGVVADAGGAAADYMEQARALLEELKQHLDRPLSFATQRQLVEALVASITIDTVEQRGKQVAKARIVYAFAPSTKFPVDNCTGTRAETNYHITHTTAIKPRRRTGGTDATRKG